MRAVGSSPAISVSSSLSSCLLLDCGQRRGAGAGLVPGDEVFEVPPLGEDGGVRRARRARASRAGIPGRHRPCRGTTSACRATGRACGRRWRRGTPGRARRSGTPPGSSRRKCSSRICVRRSRKFVGSSSSSRFGSCSSRAASFDARLPAAGELGDRAFEVRPLQLELPGDLAALPVGLAAVAHQEFEGGLAGQERIVLAQVAQPQARDGG